MQLKKVRNAITGKIALQLYESMILPIMDYADIFCHNKSPKTIKRYQVIQNRCIRIISCVPRLPNTNEEAKKLGLISIANRRALHVLQFSHELTINQHELLERYDSHGSRGPRTRLRDSSRNQFKMFKLSKVLIEKSISFMLRCKWNALPWPIMQLINILLPAIYWQTQISLNSELLGLYPPNHS